MAVFTPDSTGLGRAQSDTAISVMLEKGEIRELLRAEAKSGFYLSMFLVPKKDGKIRPVVNLKKLNEFVETHNLKKLNEFVETHHLMMEGLQTARELI